ncbi:DNA damage-inducible transcript 4 protein [Hyperolius riggenbachi]|uniref:DNA damage-inducible transcript 4 protein n=1 Tax=Hyperolius riggenbachi TaxID=752182 RepID=UPI0035A339E6
MPARGDSAYFVHSSAHSQLVNGFSPVGKGPSSVLKERPSVIRRPPPVNEVPAPVIKEVPVVKAQAPTPFVKEPPPVIKEPCPVVKEPPLPIKEAPPVVKQPTLAVTELPSVVNQPPLVLRENLTVIKEEREDVWDGKCADLSQRCNSLPGSDCESLTSSNSFSECDFEALDEPEELEEPDEFDDISIRDSDLLTDYEGEMLCPYLLRRIKYILSKAKINSLRCSQLLLPDGLLRSLGQELINLAYNEPCGLRGAFIELCVERGKVCYPVCQIEADHAIVPTFQLTVVFRLDSRLWPRLQGLFSTKPVSGSGQSMKLSPEFKVVKKRFYSSEEFIVEQC